MTTRSEQATVLGRWALLEHRHRWAVVGVWIAILLSATMANAVWGGAFADQFRIPGTEAQRAFDLLEERFPAEAGAPAYVVFKDEAGVERPEAKAAIESTLQEIAALDGVARVDGPFDGQSGFISQDGTIARAVVQFTSTAGDVSGATLDRFFAIADGANTDSLAVETGGPVVSSGEREPPGTEMFGIAAAIVILLVAFGSVVAAGMPIGAAVFGVGTGFGVVGLAATTGFFPSFAPQFAAMIGIGVGIDYSLLVVTRFREGLHAGRPVDASLAHAMATAGKSVIFAGIVVAISFLGLAFMGVPFVTSLGITGAIVVAMAVLVATTLLPALLSLVGTRLDRWHIPGVRTREGADRSGVWWRLSTAIQRRPWPYFLGSLGLLLFLATPVLKIDLGITDDGNKSTDFRSRRAYDLLAEGFGPGFNGTMLIVVDGPGAADLAPRVAAAVLDHPNVVQTTQPILGPGGQTAVFTAVPGTAPQDDATTRLVSEIRDSVLPTVDMKPGDQVLLTGSAAAFVDLNERISQRLPFLFAGVIGLSFLLLTAVFRSVLVALKAAILNLLSISAAFGVLVAIFQWGWGGSLIGIKEGPIETFAPMMLFAILFGLSMDYEVFLISRIREEYVKSGDTAEAVSHGLAATARVITAAAAIMIFVFLGFVLGGNRVIKEFGLGLATAIFVDATIVRLILVPSAMALLGRANWWLPRWLDRLLPRIDIGESAEAPAPAGSPAGGR